MDRHRMAVSLLAARRDAKGLPTARRAAVMFG
jgi:hypothetical protein